MPYPKGHTNNPNGRPLGAKNKTPWTKAAIEETMKDSAIPADNLVALKVPSTGRKLCSPLQYLVEVYNDPKNSQTMRMQAAAACVPFFHVRPIQPTATTAPRASSHPTVMEVPMAVSMAAWVTTSTEGQEELKAAVRR